MKAVIINREKDIIGLLHEEGLREVEVAGAITADGAPVNVRTYSVSKSKENMERARRSDAEYATRREHNGRVFYVLN